MIRKAVIPAAGFGTRFLPASKAVPKEMFPIAGIPLLQYHVEDLVAAGITDAAVVLLVLTFLAGAVLAVVRWSRGRFARSGARRRRAGDAVPAHRPMGLGRRPGDRQHA